MICKKCGANIADTAKFCGYCGNKVDEINNNVQNSNPFNIPSSNLTESSYDLFSNQDVQISKEQELNDLSLTNSISNPVSNYEQSTNQDNKINSNTSLTQFDIQNSVGAIGTNESLKSVEEPVQTVELPINPVEPSLNSEVINSSLNPEVVNNSLNQETVNNSLNSEVVNDSLNQNSIQSETIKNVPETVEVPAQNNQVVEHPSLIQMDLKSNNVVATETNESGTQDLNSQQPATTQTNPPTINQPIQPNNKKSKKNNNKGLFIILGVVLVVVAAVVAFMIFNKSEKNDIDALENAVENFLKAGGQSGTVDFRVTVESVTGDTVNVSSTLSYIKSNNLLDIALIVNKSALFDEMGLYARINNNSINLYTQSNVLDLLGTTSSDGNIWVKYSEQLTENILEELNSLDLNQEIDLSQTLDSKHFKFVGTEDELNHYILLVDDELLSKLDEDSMSINKGESYELDIYLDKSDKLSKINFDLSSYIKNDNIAKLYITIEFSNLGNTNLVIPEDAINSSMDIDTYISTYSNDEETNV